MKRSVALLLVLVLVLLSACVAAPAPSEAPAAQFGSRGLTVGEGLVDSGGEAIKSYLGGGLYTYSDSGSTVTFSAVATTGAVTAKTGNFTTGLTVAGTPVAVQAGSLSGGARLVCGSTTITGTGVLPTGLATPQNIQLTLGQNATGNCTHLSYTNASATVTAKCFSSALTPVAATTPVAVDWCAVGR